MFERKREQAIVDYIGVVVSRSTERTLEVRLSEWTAGQLYWSVYSFEAVVSTE